jgi:hypothetical protein
VGLPLVWSEGRREAQLVARLEEFYLLLGINSTLGAVA